MSFWPLPSGKAWVGNVGRFALAAITPLYLITRDSDLLSLGKPFGIIVITDEQFLKLAKTF
ncbi:MAG TPA: hypothetical protein VIL39_02565 [Verrucomicrobiae bacterium]|jgi:hypothetical protein